MPSHCRPAMGLNPVHFHPFTFAKASSVHRNSFDIHRAYQVDSCTSTFHPIKEDTVPIHHTPLQPAGNNPGIRPTVEEVDMETILQLGELQDWWPAPVEPHEVKPTNITELSLPYPPHSVQLSSTIIHPADIHNDHKCSTSSMFGATETGTSQSFDLQSWCSGVRSVQSPHIAIPKYLGFPTSAEPSPTTDSSPLRIEREKNSPGASTPQRRWTNNSEQTEKALSVQKKWNGKRAVTQRESHIWSERQRRKGMNHLFSTLRSLLPQPTSKTDKSTVVSEIIKYIQGLQLKLDELNKKRAEILRSSQRPGMVLCNVDSVGNSPSIANSSLATANGMNSSSLLVIPNESCLQSFVLPNVALHFSGLNAFITMSSPKKRGLFSRILLIMQTHKLDVVNAHISTSNGTVFHCLHVMASHGADFPKEALQTALQGLTTSEPSS